MENFIENKAAELFSHNKSLKEEINPLTHNLQITENIINKYNERIDYKNPHIDPCLEIILLLTKYLLNIISCFNTGSLDPDPYENNKTKMLRLYDFTSYEFKRLRNKYEDLNESYFNYDEEFILLTNIKKIFELEEIKQSLIAEGYLKLLDSYLRKLNSFLLFCREALFKVEPEGIKKLKKLVIKISVMSKIIFRFLFASSKENFGSELKNIELLKYCFEKINLKNEKVKDKWSFYFKNLFKKFYSKFTKEVPDKKGILNYVKLSLMSLMEIYNSNANEQKILNENFLNEIDGEKIFFEGIERRIFEESETIKHNEVLYFYSQNFHSFSFLENKKAKEIYRNQNSYQLKKIRILSNQILKIKYETIDLNEKVEEKRPKQAKNKEINFFGLLLKVSKDFFTPTYNLIIQINGGGCFSQSSESHLTYLKKWAINSDTVIISIDYLLTSENKFPKIFDEIYEAYEVIIKHSKKIFNFNINKLILYCDTIGSIFALDLIKNSIENKIKSPDLLVMIHPYSSLTTDEELKIKDYLHEDEADFCLSLENIKNEIINLKFNDLLIENSVEFEKENDRLNFLFTDPKYFKYFPRVFMITPENQPIKGNCESLYDFLSANKVNVENKHVLEYCNGFISLNSLKVSCLASLDSAYKCIFEFLFNTKYESKTININERKSLSTLSTVANS